MKAYTLKKSEETSELHLFEGEMTEDSCTSNKKSICGMLEKGPMTKNIFQCKDENSARILCAQTGRKVCGVCVSHLYTTY